MKTIQPQEVTPQLKTQLREVAAEATGDLHDLLMQLCSTSDRTPDVTFALKDEILTPNQAAELLGMSRTHLNKILDRGTIPHERVGTHRKIWLSAVTEFSHRRDAQRRELAERFASQDRTRSESISEIAATL